MPTLTYVSHPNVVKDPDVPVPRWGLNELGFSRARAMLAQPWTSDITNIVSSDEQKALDTSGVLAAHLGLEIDVRPCSGETDRSSTGYVSEEEHTRLAALYYAEPHKSARGWERSIDSQARVVRCLTDILEAADADVAVFGHGGVGTLLRCHLAGLPIAQEHDQPGMGHYWRYDLLEQRMLHGWRAIDDIEGSTTA